MRIIGKFLIQIGIKYKFLNSYKLLFKNYLQIYSMSDKLTALHIKCVILGEANVGKTSLITRYFYGKFHQFCESTIGCSFSNKSIEIDGSKYKLDVWDTAGQEKYRGLMPMYYRNADIVFLCIDLTEKNKSKIIENYNYWCKQIDAHSDNPDRIIILVGTKSDHRQLSMTEEEIRNLIQEKKYKYFETSSKTNSGINELFCCATKEASEIVKKRQINKEERDDLKVNINGGIHEDSNSSSCC
tara:strand:+ start:2297 stop:3022 length:726 start_codon:yes stop_codon:yes gene_type:complete